MKHIPGLILWLIFICGIVSSIYLDKYFLKRKSRKNNYTDFEKMFERDYEHKPQRKDK